MTKCAADSKPAAVPARSVKRKAAVLLVFVTLLTAAALLMRRYAALEQLVDQEDALRTWLGDHRLGGIALAFGAYVLLSLIPGTTGKSLIAGWLFGFWWSVGLINLGLTAAAIIAFLVSRYVLYDAIQSRFGPVLWRVNRALEHGGAAYVVALRVMHAPFTFVNYTLGATPIRTRTFWWATQVGLLPGNVVCAYAGAKLPTLRAIAEQGVWGIVTPELAIALAALSLFPFVVQWSARFFRARAEDTPNAAA